MPKIVDVDEKRRQILAAAARVFAQHSFRGTNLQRVAAQAKMGKSTLYHYFPSKQELFEALVRELLSEEESLFDQILRSPAPPQERFDSLIETVRAMFDEWAKAGPLIIDFVRENRGREALRHTIVRTRAALQELIAEGQRSGLCRSGSPEALATLVLGCLEGLLLVEIIEPGGTSKTGGAFLSDALSRVVFKPVGS